MLLSLKIHQSPPGIKCQAPQAMVMTTVLMLLWMSGEDLWSVTMVA